MSKGPCAGMRSRQSLVRTVNIARRSALAAFFRRQTTRREHAADIGVAGGFARGDRRPGLRVFDGIDDTAADLAIGWPGAVGAVFLQRANGDSEKARRIGRAQEARRQLRLGVGHKITCGSSWAAVGGDSGLWRTMAKHRRRVACRIRAYALAALPALQRWKLVSG